MSDDSDGSSTSEAPSTSSFLSVYDPNYLFSTLSASGVHVQISQLHEEVFSASISSHIHPLDRIIDNSPSMPFRASFADMMKIFPSASEDPHPVVYRAESFFEEVCKLNEGPEQDDHLWRQLWYKTIYDPSLEDQNIGTL